MALPPEAAGQAAESHSLAGGGAGHKRREKVDHVVIRFAGDSGDGMQLAGMQFTTESALAGNDIATLPGFPRRNTCPAGTLAGVSGFQVNFSSSEIFTAGDEPNVLVAMNPAALKANLDDVPPNGVIIADVAAFSDSNLKRAGFTSNPLDRPFARQVPGLPGRRHQDDDAGAARLGPQQPCRDALPQPVRARPGVVALSAADREHRELAGRTLPQDARRTGRQREGAQGGLQLRRNHRGVREFLRRGSGPHRLGLLPQHHRQQRDRAGLRGGGVSRQAPAVPGLLSDYARERRASRSRRLQELPGLHLPG